MGITRRPRFKILQHLHVYLRLAPPPAGVGGGNTAGYLKAILLVLLLPLSLKASPTLKHHAGIPVKSNSPVLPAATIPLLTQHLTAHCKTDSQKALAIFRWITGNISYDVCDFHKTDTPYNIIPKWPPEWGYSAYDTWHNNQVAKLVLERRIGICDGYARLFKAMCDAANVEAVCIEGYARRERGIGLEFAANHAWNAVRINGQWRLLDATWASGYCDTGTHIFTRQYNEKYWMTPPDELLQDHYPLSPEWALVKVLPPVYSFFREPLHHPAYLRTCISGYSPANGLLDASPAQTCTFTLTGTDTVLIPEISYEDYKGDWHPAEGQPVDAASFASTIGFYNLESDTTGDLDTAASRPGIDSAALRLGLLDRIPPDELYSIKGNTYTYKFKVPAVGARYIFISCNDKLLLTYAVRRSAF